MSDAEKNQNNDDIELDQIAYCSVASELLSDAALEKLLREAQILNQMDHITGAFLVHGRVFLQLFEGPPQAVQELWHRIRKDKRHRCIVKLLERHEAEQRAFEGWTMRDITHAEMRDFVATARAQAKGPETKPWQAAMSAFIKLLDHPQPQTLVEEWHA